VKINCLMFLFVFLSEVAYRYAVIDLKDDKGSEKLGRYRCQTLKKINLISC
jgi:hypothetical protein